MTSAGLAWARARARSGLLIALAATVAVIALALAVVLGSLGTAMREVVVAAVAAAPEEDRAAVLRAPTSADAAGQQAAAAAFLSGRFGATLRVDLQQDTGGGSSRWELTIDPDRLDPWQVPAVADDLAYLQRDVRDVDGLAPEGASVEGGLADTLQGAATTIRAVLAIAPVPLALVVIAGVIAALQLARLLGGSRVVESVLLRARGLSPRAARRAAITELTLTVAVGALVGWALGALAVAATTAALTGLPGGFVAAAPAALRATWIIPVVTAAVLGPLSGVAAHRAVEAGDQPQAVAARGFATAVSMSLLTLAAALFVWQLRGLDEEAGAAWTLVVTAVAPALALGAAALIVLTVFPHVAAAVAALAAARPRLLPSLPARTIARNAGAFGAVVALVALAAGGAALAGASTASWAQAGDASAALSAGADARADLGAPRVTAAQVDGVARADGVRSAAAGFAVDATAGDAGLQLQALPAAAIADVIAPGVADPRALAAALESGPVGVPLAASAATLEATYDIAATGDDDVFQGWGPDGMQPIYGPPPPPEVGALTAQAWLLDARGTPSGVDLQLTSDRTGPRTARLTARGELPAGAAPWTLLGVSVGFADSPGSQPYSATPVALAADEPIAWPSTDPIALSAAEPTAASAFAPVPSELPAVVTAPFAHLLGLEDGDVLTARLAGSSRTVTLAVAEVVPSVPGTAAAHAVLVALDPLSLALFAEGVPLAADQVWANGPDAVVALRAAVPGAPIVTADAAVEARVALGAVWWVAAGAGAVLAAVATIAAAIASTRSRATEVFVLRALGVTPAAQARTRAAELIVVTLTAIGAGLALGTVVAWLTVPALTRAAVPGVAAMFADEITLGAGPALVLLAVLGVALAAASVIVSRIMAGQARAGRVREAL